MLPVPHGAGAPPLLVPAPVAHPQPPAPLTTPPRTPHLLVPDTWVPRMAGVATPLGEPVSTPC